jgi:MtrB/PioB family decaheme-associated outer membrane protein
MRLLAWLCACGWMAIGPSLAFAQAAAPQAPTPPAPAQAAPPAAAAEDTRSLFEPTWRQFMIGGRLASVDGDPARWQRYEDLRDGLLFTNARYAREWADTGQSFRVAADNVGWRDQRFVGDYDRPGRFRVAGFWDQIPQFYSIDTHTPYTSSQPGVLVLDDNTQSAIQGGRATLSAYVPIAPQFDLEERRDIGMVTFTATPETALDLTATFRTQRHVGELPWGASFGFSNDVEIGLPYNSRANDLTIGAEWTNQKSMRRVAYDGSWFQNHDGTVVWDSPLRLTDALEAGSSTDGFPGHGRMAMWPSNTAQTVSFGGYTKLARRTQLTGFLSYGIWNNDEPLLPFTINSVLPTLTLPRATAQAEANVFSTNLNLVSRPGTDWRMSARFRQYSFDNQTPHGGIPEFVSYDSGVSTSLTGGPEPYTHSRTTFAADATWTGISPLALAVGYTHNGSGHEFRIFEDTGENVVTFTADAVGTQWATFRAQYEIGDRSGSGLNEALLVQIGEQPAMRHYDVANRSRQRFTGQIDLVPNESWTVSASAGFGQDDYDDSYFGLQEASFRTVSFGVDFMQPGGFGAGGSYNYERYTGFQQSRSASPGVQEDDPLRDWTTDSKEHVHYFSLYVTPPRIGDATEARFSYDYSNARANYFYGLVPGSPLTPPSQLPEAYNTLQELKLDVRHRLSRRLAATFSYVYEPFRVYDFAMDPSVIDSIVQPSSLVLGYVYRPYTVHSAVFSLLFLW